MKFLELLLLVFLTACNSQQADLGRISGNQYFLTQIHAAQNLVCQDLITDEEGFSYCAGATNGNYAEANGGSGYDTVLIKFDPAGEIVWKTQFGAMTKSTNPGASNSGNDLCAKVGIDAKKNVYCAGFTGDTTDGFFGGNPQGLVDPFVMKVNRDGVLQWVTQFGTSGTDSCKGFKVLPDGTSYCSGATDGELVTGENPLQNHSKDVFLAKFNSEGQQIWLRQLGNLTTQKHGRPQPSKADSCTSVNLDSRGNVYCLGSTSSDLGEPSAGDSDILIWKLDPAGNSLEIIQFGSIRLPIATEQEFGVDLLFDKQDQMYFAGGTMSSLGEAEASDIRNGLNVDLDYDPFVMKLDRSFNILWITQMGAQTHGPGGDNTKDDYCQNLVQTKGEVICAGLTKGSIGEPNANTNGSNDIFFLKLDKKNGNLIKASQLGLYTVYPGGNNAGDDIPAGLGLDKFNRVHLGGQTSGPLDGTNPIGKDLFVLKLDEFMDFRD